MSVLSKLAVFASIGLAIALIFSVISGWMLRGKWTLEYWTANFALSAVAVAFVRWVATGHGVRHVGGIGAFT